MDWREHITVNPAVLHGKACIRGTRIPVAVVLANLADGLSAEEIVKSYPSLTVTGIQAALAYAAALAQERVLPGAPPSLTLANPGVSYGSQAPAKAGPSAPEREAPQDNREQRLRACPGLPHHIFLAALKGLTTLRGPVVAADVAGRQSASSRVRRKSPSSAGFDRTFRAQSTAPGNR